MFTKNNVSQSLVDAVKNIIGGNYESLNLFLNGFQSIT